MKKAIIAMSGGVDSSVAAYLIKNQGYTCIGATMRLFTNDEIGEKPEKSCCSLDDTEDARSVASRLGMPHYVFNFSGEFKEKVIEKFVCAYEEGATPNPCIECNRYLKFDKMLQRMEELGFDYIATGHYARITEENGRFLLKKAIDEKKDQSYVLYSMTQKQLSHTLFPLGSMTKEETRKIAEENGFINAKKHDSQDICFVPDGDYASFIEHYRNKRYECGNFVDKDGNVLGTHKGIIRYTIGQRKGLGLSLPAPMYVLSKDIAKNEVVLCDNSELFSRELDAEDVNWIAFNSPPERLSAMVKIRYNQKEQPATVTADGKSRVHIEFLEPQRAIAKGQAAVFYDGDTVLGGGTIV